MSYIYAINEIPVTDEFENKILSYGVNAFLNDNLILSVYDISTDKEMIEDLIDKLNKNKLSVIHIHDVIEDIL